MNEILNVDPYVSTGAFFAPDGRYVVALFKIDGAYRKFILSLENWSNTVDGFVCMFRRFLDEDYPVCPAITLDSFYDPTRLNWDETKCLADQLEQAIRTLIKDTYPNYTGQVRTIDGRRYRLEAV